MSDALREGNPRVSYSGIFFTQHGMVLVPSGECLGQIVGVIGHQTRVVLRCGQFCGRRPHQRLLNQAQLIRVPHRGIEAFNARIQAGFAYIWLTCWLLGHN